MALVRRHCLVIPAAQGAQAPFDIRSAMPARGATVRGWSAGTATPDRHRNHRRSTGPAIATAFGAAQADAAMPTCTVTHPAAARADERLAGAA
ncbi:MAG: hypothetical protein ACK4OP_14810 [Gemmobacter sp.]